jgi:hypothetical protein
MLAILFEERYAQVWYHDREARYGSERMDLTLPQGQANLLTFIKLLGLGVSGEMGVYSGVKDPSIGDFPGWCEAMRCEMRKRLDLIPLVSIAAPKT